jgi:hypothetical protein
MKGKMHLFDLSKVAKGNLNLFMEEIMKNGISVTSLALFVGLFALAMLAGNSFAVDCGQAEVAMVGPAPGTGGTGSSGYKIKLINRTGAAVGDWAPDGSRMFYLHEDLGDAGLATALTAIATDYDLWVRIPGDGSVNSLITIMYLNKP